MCAQGPRLERMRVILIVVQMLALGWGRPQEGDRRPGQYVPEMHGGDLGKYVRDDSGKYQHIAHPYDGGYGDRGLKYIQDERNPFPRTGPFALSLAPSDHLRFMIDFNYNDSGWQIIQFEWVRDGDEDHGYKYVNENKLWSDGIAEQYADPATDNGETPYYNYNAESRSDGDDALAVGDGRQREVQAVHVEGDQSSYNVTYAEQNELTHGNRKGTPGIRHAIGEILEYIQRDILPHLP